VLDRIDLSFGDRPELIAIAGPNGSGKSSLLNVVAGIWTMYSGRCECNGQEIRHWNRRELARSVSHVPQQLAVALPFTVREVVLTGRTPHGSSGFFASGADNDAVDRAMEATDTQAFAHRRFSTLSGGERQRVILAAALAQEPRLLLLDEPTAFLDLRHQISLWTLLRNNCNDGLTAVVITHELGLALEWSDRILLLASGRLVADRPAAGVGSDLLSDVFSVPVNLTQGPDGKRWMRYGP
jgi:iron complex transport system ATP-binding protein